MYPTLLILRVENVGRASKRAVFQFSYTKPLFSLQLAVFFSIFFFIFINSNGNMVNLIGS